MNAEWTTFLADRLPELWLRIGQHLVLTGVSVAFAILIGVPLGIVAGRVAWLRSLIVGAAGVLQTIPSLAMLTLLLALLQRIGAVPAILALTLYCLLPIVRNTIAGLEGVSGEVLEAARGVGMSGWQELHLVRLPLALPVIVAGIRIAAVAGVGIATLSAFIGAGGLGQFINRGLALADTRLILLGAIPAALLALLVDFALGAANWALNPRRKTMSRTRTKTVTRIAAIILPFFIFATGGIGYVHGRPDVTIGSKNFTEQIILGHMMALLIEEHTNLKVDRRFNLGGTMISHGALVHDEIDLYAEYTGTGLTAVLGEEPLADPDQVYETVSREYRARFDIQWLEPFGMNNTYVITVRQADAERYGWVKVSDLEPWAEGLHAGFPGEFVERPDGYPGFQKAYGFEFGQVNDIDPGLMYDAVAHGEVDVIAAFATDGRIAAYDLRPLDDDRRFFPPYHAAPVVRTATLRQHPQVRTALEKIAGALDDQSMRQLNSLVDREKRSPKSVARAFLFSKGLLQKTQKRN